MSNILELIRTHNSNFYSAWNDDIIRQNEIDKDIFKDKTVLITGAAGSIGKKLAWVIGMMKPKMLLLLDQAESPLFHLQQFLKAHDVERFRPIVSNIRNQKRIASVFNHFSPQIVIHTAAYKHVPLMEDHPLEAFENNVMGTLHLIQEAMVGKTEKFLYLSTDKAVHPVSIMGRSKLIGEIYIKTLSNSSSTDFSILRFGNVLGTEGSVYDLFCQQLKSGLPLTLTHTGAIRYFISMLDACKYILQSIQIMKGINHFLFNMGDPISIYDLAIEMLNLKSSSSKEEHIKTIGLRKGERMSECLIANNESLTPTKYKNIKRIISHPINSKALRAKVSNCCNAYKQGDAIELDKKMQELTKMWYSDPIR